ncbi:hypothetical protein EDF31_11113 [Curtobacterium sp. PhB142]|uniref:hypothetical protein n=1 Tax=unclassified Curtobacterium TaxID=257496 RepID=UPI00104F6E73|nr:MULTISPECIES: hypothetical protein [unclassified Curtobacterium]TCL81573.1 hypothetical protein EDF31_11113 [Curtobacterium sp. PhB142]TCL99888.1 hypothetical protein EDF26_11272 [Curtobacterium sp. PhB134]
MSSDNRFLRATFGRPLVWVGVVWLAVGVLWSVLAIIDPSTFRAIMAVLWLVLGGSMLTAALRDRKRGLGRYQR